MIENKGIPIIAVVGPTASGKTKLAVEIAKNIDGEVVSFDSMQIYKELSIATAKPTAQEMQGIKHHLISIKSVTEEYSVADYVADAKNAVKDILDSGKLPVFVGGTGLYIDSFINNIDFTPQSSNTQIRKQLQDKLNSHGSQYMYNLLSEIDPQAAKKLHINNTKRIIRALEVYYLTGKTITEQQALSKRNSPYLPLFIGLNYKDRQKLYDRINLRVDLMLKEGLLQEVKNFYNSNPSLTASQAIGSKELRPFLDNKQSLDVCIENLKRETRRYAKRQITWFKRNSEINWFYPDVDDFSVVCQKAIALAKNFLK